MSISYWLVPHISQIGVSADEHRSDCGAAAVASMIKGFTGISISVDKLYNEMQSGDGYLSVQQIQRTLQVHGIPNYWKPNSLLVDLFVAISNGTPPIVLFNYGTFGEMLGGKVWDKNFKGAHFAIICGMDSMHFFVVDPLWPTGSLMPIAIKHKSWMKAWDDSRLNGNQPCGMIVPTISILEDISIPSVVTSELLYKVKVVCKLLKVRTSPIQAQTNWTGILIPTDAIKDVYEEKIVGTDVWVRILPTAQNWMAREFQGETLAVKI